jgi:hypothetical protein
MPTNKEAFDKFLAYGVNLSHKFFTMRFKLLLHCIGGCGKRDILWSMAVCIQFTVIQIAHCSCITALDVENRLVKGAGAPAANWSRLEDKVPSNAWNKRHLLV